MQQHFSGRFLPEAFPVSLKRYTYTISKHDNQFHASCFKLFSCSLFHNYLFTDFTVCVHLVQALEDVSVECLVVEAATVNHFLTDLTGSG